MNNLIKVLELVLKIVSHKRGPLTLALIVIVLLLGSDFISTLFSFFPSA